MKNVIKIGRFHVENKNCRNRVDNEKKQNWRIPNISIFGISYGVDFKLD